MSTIFNVLDSLLLVYLTILVLRSLTTWLRLDPENNEVARFLYIITEPVLEPIRSVLPPTGMIDFSPIVAVIAVIALRMLLSILASGF